MTPTNRWLRNASVGRRARMQRPPPFRLSLTGTRHRLRAVNTKALEVDASGALAFPAAGFGQSQLSGIEGLRTARASPFKSRLDGVSDRMA
jgi:hypothetical protein